MTSIPPYPLRWPDSLPRTKRPGSAQFSTTLYKAMKNVEESLRLFGKDSGKPATDVVTTSNAALGTSNPADSGVAVWFVWEGKQVCFAVDKYAKVEHNVQAIHKIIEARRTELRHGGLNIVRATFKGFQALPAPDNDAPWTVLGVARNATPDQVQAAYRLKAKKAHPDAGGSIEQMARLNSAKQAMGNVS